MKKTPTVAVLALVLFAGLVAPVIAAPVSWDGNVGTGILQPLQSMWGSTVKFSNFTATSTTVASLIDYRLGVGSTTPYAKFSVTNTTSAPSFVVEDSTSPDTTPFVIDSAGNTGVGTSTPPSKFTIEGTNSNTGGLRLCSTTGTDNCRWAAYANGNTSVAFQKLSANGVFSYLNSAGGEEFRLNNNGFIGIGTTSPFSKLSLTGAGTGTGRGVSIANSSNVDNFYTLDNGNAYFRGNVGIGSTNPISEFVVGGAQVGNAGIEFDVGSGGVAQCYNRTSAAYCSFTFDGSATSFRTSGTSGNLHTFRQLTTTLAGTTVGANFDFTTSVTNASANMTGINLTTAAVTAASSNTLRGINIAPGAITNTSGSSTYNGITITMPAITQSVGTLTSVGLNIVGGTVTSGTAYALTTDSTAGNVGIGTTTPSSALDIWGKIKGRIGAALASFNVGGTVADFFTDVGNGTTVETDLYSYTIPASGFNTNGDKVVFTSSGIFVSSGTATRQIRAYFGGTQVFDTGALSISASADWSLEVTCIRVSSSVVRCTGLLNTSGASLAAYTDYTEVTGLTLTNTQIIKTTGQAGGVGAATNDIVAKMGYIDWKSNDD